LNALSRYQIFSATSFGYWTINRFDHVDQLVLNLFMSHVLQRRQHRMKETISLLGFDDLRFAESFSNQFVSDLFVMSMLMT
jgi:hypothetical protein